MIEVLDIGDEVASGSYRLHCRFRSAVVFVSDASGELAAVVDETNCAGPRNIVVRGVDFERAESLEVAAETVSLDGAALPVRRRADSRLPTCKLDGGRLRQNLEALRQALRVCGAGRSLVFLLEEPGAHTTESTFEREMADRLRGGVARLMVGDDEGAAAIRGVGFGLTPSGDDFLAGFLLGLYALEAAGAGCFAERRQAIRALAAGSNPFSEALLTSAVEGRAIEPARLLVAALFAGTKAEVAGAVGRLAAVGASSGADLATGLYFGLGAAAW